MFSKLLIANRGEIACRIIETARRMGLPTVAVYSDADREALHVLRADEGVRIGPPPANESYLSIDSLLEACRATGADAVHPGYGFLSENPEFAARLLEAGITFIGPRPPAIRRMGDKVTAKQLAREAGVNTIPGDASVMQDAAEAVAIARKIGYPVMLKAAAGGGGKGMRVARSDAECREGFQRATSEAKSAFADGRVFVEKYFEHPRHIEIQIVADQQGNIVHLGERECSLQRRHQKVIEEAPSPGVDAALRAEMGRQAIALAAAVEYESVGTVEFIVDSADQFFFLEMNTRLQVEHPVTEFVTGLDLVELMIRIAAGESLPFAQADVNLDGWAIEARVYAEDPARGFLPSVGRLVRYLPPDESPSIRVDTGVYQGGEVSMHYDPLMAKLVAHGATREEATNRLSDALNHFHIRGVGNNVRFLAALIDHDRFRQGRLSTNFIGEEYPDGFRASDASEGEVPLLIAVAASIHRRYMERAARISGQLPGYERKVPNDWVVLIGAEQHPVEVNLVEGGEDVTFGGKRYAVRSDWRFGEPLFRCTFDGKAICLQVERHDMHYRLAHGGAEIDVMVLTPRAAELLACMPATRPADTSSFLLSPMPGLLTQMFVEEGHEVGAGQDLVVVEAMKMENVLRAERDGRVEKMLAAVGDTLAVDQPILKFAG